MAGPAGELAAPRGRGKGLRKTPCGEDSICSGIAKLMVTSFIVPCIRDVMCKQRKARQERGMMKIYSYISDIHINRGPGNDVDAGSRLDREGPLKQWQQCLKVCRHIRFLSSSYRITQPQPASSSAV
eukprot:scaffold750_cov342-Pinguiococcus_pyrenoidosus.AAC.2